MVLRAALGLGEPYDSSLWQVCHKAGLPEDGAYLPHGESVLTAWALSSAGAVGIWQCMPTTGRRFLRIDSAVDERYDPVSPPQEAARFFA